LRFCCSGEEEEEDSLVLESLFEAWICRGFMGTSPIEGLSETESPFKTLGDLPNAGLLTKG